MLHQTKGIVLRTIKYGETSIIVNIYTELFGVQHYLVQGVRTEKRSSAKANLYQAGTLLELIVYHHPNKDLQRIKEAHISYLYQQLHQHMVKNTLMIYMLELISRTMTEPEANPDLFLFFEENLKHIDAQPVSALTLFPLNFTLELASQLGFSIQDTYTNETPILDLVNGRFCTQQDLQSMYFLEGDQARWFSCIANAQTIDDTQFTVEKRQALLMDCIQYLRLHIPSMGELKTLPILHAILH